MTPDSNYKNQSWLTRLFGFPEAEGWTDCPNACVRQAIGRLMAADYQAAVAAKT